MWKLALTLASSVHTTDQATRATKLRGARLKMFFVKLCLFRSNFDIWFPKWNPIAELRSDEINITALLIHSFRHVDTFVCSFMQNPIYSSITFGMLLLNNNCHTQVLCVDINSTYQLQIRSNKPWTLIMMHFCKDCDIGSYGFDIEIQHCSK